MRSHLLMLCAWSLGAGALRAAGPETWLLPLSGKGPADAVEWDFRVTAGRRAGEQAKLPVPSQWEQHGFGDYDYGSVPAKDKHKEDGIYSRRFTVPAAWQGRRVRIVFDGVMTDASVTINGKAAGPTHQGAFYRFHHDITDLVRFGAENEVGVLVSKDSANPSIEAAERDADFWVFGGIFRPVWLEARPERCIERTAIDARADGSLRADVFITGGGTAAADRVVARVLTIDGKPIGTRLEAPVRADGKVDLAGKAAGVSAWSAEEPSLYQLEIALMAAGTVVHRVVERFGFRTLETRPGQGVFVNGRRVTIKGVNRHCFRPASGRALDPQDSWDDVRLIKEMNMNAVRCSHYSPDQAFLEACDELGLYVIDELCTWQRPTLDTPSARRLVGELVRRDVNHPSILWWANGNEGGWNTEVDGDYAQWDLQQRPVLHPWEEFSGYQTKHYPVWQRLQQDLAGPHLVMPTEFLHGLYDGGHGAGLEDYWRAITSRPNGVGGFLWSFADEGIMRSDRNGAIDNWGTNAPDGIVGPRHEKEASFRTIKDIFCPIRIALRELPADFTGEIGFANHYDHRSTSTVAFDWWLERRDRVAPAPQRIEVPAVSPGGEGSLRLPLPADWRSAEVLCLRATDREGLELWTWRWPVKDAGTAAREAMARQQAKGNTAPVESSTDGMLAVRAAGIKFGFDRGLLTGVGCSAGRLGFANGPRLVGAPAATGASPDPALPATDQFTLRKRRLESGALRLEATSAGPFEAFAWTIRADGWLDLEYRYRIDQATTSHGITFDLPEAEILEFAWAGQGPERVWANRMRGTGFGSFSRKFQKLEPGIDYAYPHCAGFYAGVRQADIRTKSGTLTVVCHQDGTFLRIGTNDEGSPVRTHWPTGDFSILHAIPAIGNKFHKPEQLGPQSIPHPAPGVVSGKVSFRFGP